MPYSYPEFKNEIKEHFKKYVPKNTRILDVGPGAGVYADVLKELEYNIDCLEIWSPYVSQFNLEEKYNKVIIGDIRYFDFSGYEYIIMGDVLEHLSYDDAKIIIDKIEANNIRCLIAVPYNYIQGEYDGNKFETHLQPDLTPENVLIRYPNLKPLNICYSENNIPFYGYYVNYLFELTEIFNHYGSDKGIHHFFGWEGKPLRYTEVYEEYFKPMRYNNINFMEIGTHDSSFPGASISAWTSYFKNINFYGYDIVNCERFNTHNIKTFLGDQNSSEDLVRFINNNPVRFDIVIDDGSHILEHIIKTFTHIFPHVKKGGYYFIEDLMVIDLEKLITFLNLNKENLEIKNYTLYNNNWLILIEK
jgi:hypothetical protein